ncbi:multidrug effflux MFS transporter [Pseudomonas stutzeri]|nr:multidrug effflux MFS transporter [Stutzerimonas stutzeri]
MYLPGMAAIADDFAISPGRVQQTLSIFLAGLAIGQAVYGPLLDRYGRRLPLLLGIAIFVVGSVIAACAPTVECLLAARFLQAIGAAAGLVAPRAIIADTCDITSSARVFSLLMQVMMIAPVIAPMLGGLLLIQGSWRLIFWVLAVLGAIGLVWGLKALPESLPMERRVPISAASVLRGYTRQMQKGGFMLYTLAGGCVMASLFSYISSAAFVFTDHFALSPTVFSYLFATNSIALILGGTLSSVLLTRGAAPLRVTLGGLVLHTLAGGVLYLLVLEGIATLWVYSMLLALAVGALGLILGNIVALTMSISGAQAGVASALMGTLHYLVAAVVGYLSSLFTQGPAVMPLVVALCGVAAIALALAAQRMTARQAEKADHYEGEVSPHC